ncbi:MAG TPA: thiol:disulfide interchange protein DsbA/DsbL [Burkholderiaceae bacterium]|nr:thiol:disulfide interchange protein DsbA/DsbL [Burkholderiaceae bacterium]
MFAKRRQVLIAVAAVPVTAWAQPARQPQEMKDFRPVSPPQPTEGGNKIEVLEFFQYSCPHCLSYDPTLQGWRKTLPADVEYRRIPISWDDKSVPHVRIYYTLEALGKVNEQHSKVFEAIQTKRMPLLKPEEIADYMATQGIDRKQWLDAYNSFSVGARTNRAGQVWRAYKIDGTPSMAIDGKYVTSPSMVRSAEGSLQVMDSLIQRARAERKK